MRRCCQPTPGLAPMSTAVPLPIWELPSSTRAFRGGRRLTAALDDFNRKFDGDRSTNRVVHRRVLISPANEISEGRLVGICGSETDHGAYAQWSRRNIGTDSQHP